MGTVAPRLRLKIAMQDAMRLAEEYHEKEVARFDGITRKWQRVSDRRKRMRKRFQERMVALEAALEAMRVAEAKL